MSDDYSNFIQIIKQQTGIDLSLYKEAQMKRRLTSLYEKRGHSSFMGYYDAISFNELFFKEFLERITINVSEFYRNPQRWEALDNRILPNLLKGKPKLAAWSAGCSTGEEAYSLAMIMSKRTSLTNVSVLATDIDENALQKAKMGLYSNRLLTDLPESFKEKYFIKQGMFYKLSNELINQVIFDRQNILTSTFNSQFDLIVCRNVMIYFTEEAKYLLYQKLSDALSPGGILFVGSTEQVVNPSKYRLSVVEPFFYRKQS
ncbi:protein-glutamate O-methyltransferase CheR [Jeotgalibacillus sp. S-D1]|uniref:CheR family methyltransferase n=1 Tax=Jeotgalibacillus sp. S-D1 TaxID=2552189 RepID=UPI00105A3E3D|nr:protein-glutamate O-methyltransferase CheR [Jeotgalibacillus sp. S-D1]TDL34734.1 protein-glutamate O-methyltransferase CheR [Jeotgalibacillus sp. S-D1]